MAVFDDGTKAFLEAYTYFSNLLGKGMEKTAKKFAEEATGVKAPEKLEPVIPGNEVIRIPSKVEKGELMSINSTFSDPLKSDLVLSKIDGTAGSKYSVLRSETERMFPQFTQDLQYIKDNNIALTTIQKNNIINNLRLKRSLQTEIKKLETNLIADKKNPQMIFEAYTSASTKPTAEGIMKKADNMKKQSDKLSDMEIERQNIYRPKDDQLPLRGDESFDELLELDKQELLKEGQEMFKGFKPKVIEGGKGKTKKAGQGRFTKSEVLIARMKNTLKETSGKKDSDSKYVQKNFPNFIKELEAKPELANDKNVFDSLGGPLPKNQRFVEYDDGTMDFFQQTEFGPQNIAPTQKLAQELGISTSEASAILKMEPEDRVLEIQRIKTLAKQIEDLSNDKPTKKPTSLYDENFDDYFKPDDKPKQAKGGIISLT